MTNVKYHTPRLLKESNDPIIMKKAIAHDVLIRLSEGSLLAMSMYLANSYRYVTAKNAADLRSKFIDNPECSVCAIGAVFTSGIRLYNQVTPSDLMDISRGAASKLPQKWFTHDELALMEMYFEACGVWRDSFGGVHNAQIENFQILDSLSDKIRMKAIFETIAETGIVDETAIIKRLSEMV